MIREAGAADATAIATIHVRGWQVAYAGILPAAFLDSLSIAQRTAYWQKNLRPDRHGTLVCVEKGNVIGWIDHGASRDADRVGEAEVYAIYVHPDHWSRGAGTQLLRRAEQDIFGGGVARVSLWVLEQNAPARRFYERRGLIDDGYRKTILIDGTSLVEMRYEKREPVRGAAVTGV